MPFKIVRDDITHIDAEVLVNSANPHAVIGGGVDAAIHMAAGPKLIEARQKIGEIEEGNIAYTPGFNLKAQYVIHAVGPDCRKPQPNMEEKLRACYANSLELAKELGCESIAFPLISSGIYACPKDKAFQIAISAISDFLMENDMDVTLVVFDAKSYVLSTKLFHDVQAYVDEHYVETMPRDAGISELDKDDLRSKEFISNYSRTAGTAERRMASKPDKECIARGRDKLYLQYEKRSAKEGEGEGEDEFISAYFFEHPVQEVDMEQACYSIKFDEDMPEIITNGETFTEMLLRLIDKTGKTDAEIYRKADQTRQLFSKIRNQKHYQPSKNTVLSFAIALELNMDQTMDLLKTAGYTLSDGIKIDVAFQYFIKSAFYDLMQIKIILFGMELEF
jgi:O-acetyl-ADP-ribose deacetylase (regulator of RNase III)